MDNNRATSSPSTRRNAGSCAILISERTGSPKEIGTRNINSSTRATCATFSLNASYTDIRAIPVLTTGDDISCGDVASRTERDRTSRTITKF